MNTFSRQCVEVYRQCRHQGFTLTGAHLRDLALMQRHTTDQLNIEVAHTHDALRRLTTGCKRFRQNLIERLALL